MATSNSYIGFEFLLEFTKPPVAQAGFALLVIRHQLRVATGQKPSRLDCHWLLNLLSLIKVVARKWWCLLGDGFWSMTVLSLSTVCSVPSISILFMTVWLRNCSPPLLLNSFQQYPLIIILTSIAVPCDTSVCNSAAEHCAPKSCIYPTKVCWAPAMCGATF